MRLLTPLFRSSTPTQNRMRRSLALFERIINNPYFTRTSIILFFTKLDIFRDKVTTGKVS
jgi:guanine nucleotide-binding protein subunit alpha